VFDADSLIDILLPGAVSGLVQINGGPLRGSQLDGMKLFSLGAYDVVDSYSREEAVRRASAFGFETMLVVNRSGSDFAVERIELSGAR
jgi:hypothetical protein